MKTERLALPLKLSAEIRYEVRFRARFLCEYCQTDERWQLVQFTVDHIVPISDGGSNELSNLALACFHCNRRKSNKLLLMDQVTGEQVSIYDPRTMSWADHFAWSSDALRIFALSPTGRVTIDLLDLNRPRILQIRQADKLVNRHPPQTD